MNVVDVAEPKLARAVPKLEARGLYKQFYRGSSRMDALYDVNLVIQPGEFVAVLGASGCGKTTLLRIIDGLEQATGGELLIDGNASRGTGVDRGFVFQQDNLLPWRNVLRNVMFGLELQRRPRAETKAQAMQYIDMVGLSGFEKHYPHELSGGMRQRVNLARAFTISPDVLLMDEPFAALDAQTREVMQTELLRIWRQAAGGRTVVFVTHQIDEAIFLADRIVVMTARPGRIKEVIDVPFPRPRDLHIKRTAEFGEIYDSIWKTIEQEVRVSMGMSTS
ncbi:ABC transporter ATP-binding protein [Rugosimonospora africana]|uniref:Nitrate ABC transporter ATP-binding protein n=1 Tax=Rugosimonospora africana TaxID=556532 RepID=A0A8J3R6I1_9ACTN|nr:ABC transporter ATP-binding protein [Rugosimonospora africana]GIH20931.1 nitrate ABC transporter ATP-binding protein [Rugosimonospora africana]